MADPQPERPIVREFGDALWHWSLPVVVVLSTSLTVLAHAGAACRDIAGPVFAVAGTLVALILPAASLSGAYMDPGLTFWASQLADEGADVPAVTNQARRRIAQMSEVVTPLWRGFVFVMIAFLLSTLALLRPGLAIGAYSAEEVLVGASLALIIAAVVAFMPFTWEVLRLKLAREAMDKLFVTRATEPAAPAEHPAHCGPAAADATPAVRVGKERDPAPRRKRKGRSKR